MIINVVSVLLIALFFNIGFPNYSCAAINIIEINKVTSPNVESRIERIINDKSPVITEEIKSDLMKLKQKIKNYEVITQEELEFIRNCELDIIRSKLGDAQFEEYCKLIEKREGNGEFLPPERYRLYELEKQLNSVR